MSERWTVLSISKAAAEVFHKKGLSNGRLDADLLLADIVGCDRLGLYTRYDMPVTDEQRTLYRERVRRRMTGEPLAYILGRRDFLKWTFIVTPDVLIPRPDTEDVVEAAIDEVKKCGEDARILDIGTGSGCIAVSIALSLPLVRVTASDKSHEALAVARRNADALGVGDRLDFRVGDLFSCLGDADREAFDVIVSNPPYITHAEGAELERDVRLFEPHLALFSPSDGLFFHRRIIDDAGRYLTKKGAIVFELPGSGGEELGHFARERFPGATFEVRRDLGGHERAFILRLV